MIGFAFWHFSSISTPPLNHSLPLLDIKMKAQAPTTYAKPTQCQLSTLPYIPSRCKKRFLLQLSNSPTSTTISQNDFQNGQPISNPTPNPVKESISFVGVHHVGLLCENTEKSLKFYQDILGLEINPNRPDDKLPYKGAWLWIGTEMIHLMELPNPDPFEGRPEHGGRDRHLCIAVQSLEPIIEKLEEQGITYTKSKSGRPAIFFRDPDMNCLEIGEMGERQSWRQV
eukprot:TRINITY_DN17097_c0_g1_i1.p2 TRINITY_DN17097_c0_g1~~TRINITY_DN17097_c0_g1_i1.p2  ORF type:complete len:253 (-),score=22.35 TRINITY_DN17097_c0_g1_i1:290-970(-)